MEGVYFFGVIVILGLVGFLWKRVKETKSPYHLIKKKLDEDLRQAKFSSDWKKRQEISMQLLWLEIVKEEESKDFLGRKKDDSEWSISDLEEDDIKFPTKWDLDSFLYPLVRRKSS